MSLFASVVYLLVLFSVCRSQFSYDDEFWSSVSPEEEEDQEDYESGIITFFTEPEYTTNLNSDENEVDVDKIYDTDSSPVPGESEPEVPNISIENITEILDKLLSDFQTQQKKIIDLEEANKKLILKIDSLEQQVKTNSIILSNVPERRGENSKTTLQKTLHVFNRIMKVRTHPNDIAVALRAESKGSGESRPIVVRFTNFATKMKVLAANKRLSNTDLRVSSDYSELVAKRRAELIPYLKKAKSNGQRAFIVYDKLIVDGIPNTLESLQEEERKNKEIEVQENKQDKGLDCSNSDEIMSQSNPKEQVEELDIDPRMLPL